MWAQRECGCVRISHQVGPIATRQILRYASYTYDPESNLYYLSSRTYDPVTRQFLSKDLSRNDGEESAYQYCGGNPVLGVDPTGYSMEIGGVVSHHNVQTARELEKRRQNPASTYALALSLGNPILSAAAWYSEWDRASACVAVVHPIANAIGNAYSRAGEKVFGRHWTNVDVGIRLLAVYLAGRSLLGNNGGGRIATNTAPPLRPGPNNTLRGPDGRFVTNPNSARIASASASPGAPHGNSLSHPGPTDVYGLYDVDGNLLKWGISNDVTSRYPSSYMLDKYYEIVYSGTRAEAAAFERALVQSNPGPLNFEPWAGVTR